MSDRIRVRCATCKREFSAVVPRGGDGSELRPRHHRNVAGATCDGVYRPGLDRIPLAERRKADRPMTDSMRDLLRKMTDPGGHVVRNTMGDASRARSLSDRGYAIRDAGKVWTATDAGREVLQ